MVTLFNISYRDHLIINYIIGDRCNQYLINFVHYVVNEINQGDICDFCVALFAFCLMGLMGLNAERSASIWGEMVKIKAEPLLCPALVHYGGADCTTAP